MKLGQKRAFSININNELIVTTLVIYVILCISAASYLYSIYAPIDLLHKLLTYCIYEIAMSFNNIIKTSEIHRIMFPANKKRKYWKKIQ